MTRLFIPTDTPKLDGIARTEADPEARLAAAVIIQAIDDMSRYPGRGVRRKTKTSIKDAVKEADAARLDAESFFLSDRCLFWLSLMTTRDMSAEQIRTEILNAEIDRRAKRQSPSSYDKYWLIEAKRLRTGREATA